MRPQWFKPFRFAGIGVSVRTQDDGRRVESFLNYNLETCIVEGLVTLNHKGILTSKGLEDPDADPWFLMEGKFRDLTVYFIANDQSEYYPVVSGDNSAAVKANGTSLRLVNRHDIDRYKRDTGLNWTQFSDLDYQIVSEAISAYLRTEMFHAT